MPKESETNLLAYFPPAMNNPFLTVIYLSLQGWRYRKDAPLMLDAFCGAGGAAWGYWLAGYNVVGVDINPQANYPFPFIQGDAVQFIREHGGEFDIIHASPPCQAYSVLTPTEHKRNHPDLIGITREVIQALGKPCVIENVAGARKKLHNALMLCGSMFGLNLWRHRYFEISPQLWFAPAVCNHQKEPVLISGTFRRKGQHRREYNVAECADALEIWWMIRTEIDETIPPAFTEWLGRQLMSYIADVSKAT